MAWAVVRGKYKMPWATFFTALLCLVYLLSPADFIPDVLPVLGITDDGTFILLVLAMLHKDLTAYRQSKINKTGAVPVSGKKEEQSPAGKHNFSEDLKK